MIEQPLLSISIVSHGQGGLIASLLADLLRLRQANALCCEIILTLNIPENEAFLQSFSDLGLKVIRNERPKGFGANHNAAFQESSGKFFVVVNPDIRIQSLEAQDLIAPFQNPDVSAVAPLVLSGDGQLEDNARRFPTLFRFAKRVLFRERRPDYNFGATTIAVDWVAGMFVVFRQETYKTLGGFDDRRFFMYLEDADICRRMHKNGAKVVINPAVQVTHLAQRASRRNLTHMRWHAISAFRYLTGL
ncbi:glycosyltransferase [Chitinimonas taiwanensis]|uniref:glycosyltransferase n=1 Tax=Chitinimonas taiwanensis TaxID=240412 RepID=UPI0035B41B5D